MMQYDNKIQWLQNHQRFQLGSEQHVGEPHSQRRLHLGSLGQQEDPEDNLITSSVLLERTEVSSSYLKGCGRKTKRATNSVTQEGVPVGVGGHVVELG